MQPFDNDSRDDLGSRNDGGFDFGQPKDFSGNTKAALADALKESAKIVASMPPESREFRTVLVPTLIQKEDIKNIAEILPKDASWQFAQFRNENCLDPSYNELSPYTDAEIKELIDYAKSFIPGAELR